MVIVFDFDGTVATDGWPDISKAKPNRAVIDWLKKRAQMGDKLILWKCRRTTAGSAIPMVRILKMRRRSAHTTWYSRTTRTCPSARRKATTGPSMAAR